MHWVQRALKLHTRWRIHLRAGISFALLLFAFLSLTSNCRAQISPGPLSKAHQSLNGGSNCTKCHAINTRSASFRCVDCHTEIGNEIKTNRGLHATFPRDGAPGAACVKCHSEHNGENFQMIHWNPTPQGFDHTKTGYTLDGKHAQVTCRACHTAQHIPAASRAALGTKDLSRTWMGLTPSCANCHEDKHQGRFGTNCAQCHSTTDWKAAKINQQSFDHSKTRFPLTGMHRSVDCEKCHTTGDDGQQRFAGIAFAWCADCHRDPHKGEFKQGCDSCHTTTTWKRSKFTSTFDHSKTAFPLAGKHLEVECTECHVNGDFKSPIAHTACADCHKPDPHSGQFLARTDKGKCESCHTVQGWAPSTFSVADHAKTGFPLSFPHASVQCAQCHTPAGKETKFKIKYSVCTDCHADEHQGQFAGAPWRNECQQCHTGATFKTTTFTLAKHQQLNFKLTGGHEAVACNECHTAPAGSKTVRFHFASLNCQTCHDDPHNGQFAQRMAVKDKSGKVLGCEACHVTKDWHDLSKFDHAQTQFQLAGAHRAVACIDCHKPPAMELNMRHVDFTKAPQQCVQCHVNPHADQFGERASQCTSCHNTNKWKPSLFNHDKTAFALKGGHENVACSACHTQTRVVNGTPVLFYKPTPVKCESCHGATVPQPSKTSFLRKTVFSDVPEHAST